MGIRSCRLHFGSLLQDVEGRGKDHVGPLQLNFALLPGLEEDDPPHSFAACYSALAAAYCYF